MASLAVSAAVFVASLAVLLVASDVFTSRMERVGIALGISPFVVDATIVSAGTTLPELASSTLAVVPGHYALPRPGTPKNRVPTPTA